MLRAQATSAAHPASTQPWLRTAGEMSAPPDSSNLGAILRAYRSANSLTQGQLAELLLTTQSNLSRIESGRQHIRDIDQLRWMAERMGLPPEHLGLLPVEPDDDAERRLCRLGTVGDSQRHWVGVRRELNHRRHTLGPFAAQAQPDHHRAAPGGVLAHQSWLPANPVDLAAVELSWHMDSPTPRHTGSATAAVELLPLADEGHRYGRYSRAIRDLARPTLFDNRVCYRPLAIEWAGDSGRFSFGYTSYFEALDVCESLGHEYAAAWLANDGHAPTLEQLPLRRAMADPFDLISRPAAMSLNTLTVRRTPGGAGSFLLHKRSSTAVAAAGGMYHVVPAGVFQPSSISPWHQANDFDLWRNIMREFAEELLGIPEHDGNSGQPIDYAGSEPFRALGQARDAGRIRAYCLGVVVEPLTWWVEAQTVVVLDADVFDQVFHSIVAHNDEGYLLATDPSHLAEGIPFTEDSMRRLASEPLAPVAANLLQLAWKHRQAILER